MFTTYRTSTLAHVAFCIIATMTLRAQTTLPQISEHPSTKRAAGSRPGNTQLTAPRSDDHQSPMRAFSLGVLSLPPSPLGDTLKIDTVLDCTTLTVSIKVLNARPAGLRSVKLDPATVRNARLVGVTPPKLSDIAGSLDAVVRVLPIDPRLNASATMIITDSTGKTWRVYYAYEADYLVIDPQPELNYGERTEKHTVTRTVTVTNPLTRPLVVRQLSFVLGTQGYAIVKSTPAVPATLAPKGKLLVDVSTTPQKTGERYVDTLKIKLGCIDVPLPLITETARPKIYAHDDDFGVFVLGVDSNPRTRPLTIENIGTGEITFDNPDFPSDPTKLITWQGNGFSIDPNAIAALKGKVLKANEKVDIPVTFDPTVAGPGNHRTTARVFANTRDIRDTSIWTARVIPPGQKLIGYDWRERWVVAPLNKCTKNREGFYLGEVIADNIGTSDDEVTSLTIEGPDAPNFAFDTTDPSKSIRPGDILLRGGARPLHQRVRFLPREERPYEANIVLRMRISSPVTASLRGIGIESHGAITGYDFGVVKFEGPSNPPNGTRPVPGTVRLIAKPTRNLIVTDIRITGDTADFFINKTLFALPRELRLGDTMNVSVEFRPQTPGTHTARIVFLGDQSQCDDSTNLLAGHALDPASAVDDAPAAMDGLSVTCAPNPVTATARIVATQPTAAAMRVEIFDGSGTLVRRFDGDATTNAGTQTFEWDGASGDGRRCPSGIYRCRLTAGDHTAWTSIVLAR